MPRTRGLGQLTALNMASISRVRLAKTCASSTGGGVVAGQCFLLHLHLDSLPGRWGAPFDRLEILLRPYDQSLGESKQGAWKPSAEERVSKRPRFYVMFKWIMTYLWCVLRLVGVVVGYLCFMNYLWCKAWCLMY
jgi:hypothetical protein